MHLSDIIPEGETELVRPDSKSAHPRCIQNPTELGSILRNSVLRIIEMCRLSDEEALSLVSELFKVGPSNEPGEISPPTTPDSFCDGVGEAPHFAKPPKPSRGRAYISVLETSEADDIRGEAAIAQNLIPISTLSGDEGTILRLETQLFEAQAKIQEFAIGETRKHVGRRVGRSHGELNVGLLGRNE